MDNTWLAPGQFQAILRHVYTGVASASAMALWLGMSQSQFDNVSGAIHQIGDGLAAVVAGIATLVPVVSATYAAFAQSREHRLEMMNKDPQIAQVVTMPGTEASAAAAKIPGTKVS